MRLEHLAIISRDYPSPGDPSYAFVEQLAIHIARTGVRVSVIAPCPIVRRKAKPPVFALSKAEDGTEIEVYRPRYLGLSGRRRMGIDLPMIALQSFIRAAGRVLRGMKRRPDALYGHFIAQGGLCAAALGREFGIPSFLGYGESTPDRYKAFDNGFIEAQLRSLAGVVSVSEENARELVRLGLVRDASKIRVFPNAADEALFHPGDRQKAREALGIPREGFIVAFVGSFDERKGVLRAAEAIRRIGGTGSFFIGRGALQPDCPGILFCGTAEHNRIPLYLTAADAFVLPTRSEGCCNAIVEALACGLPVITSDLPCNDGLVDHTNGIRVDPDDTGAIAEAIDRLKQDEPLRARLAQGAREKGKRLSMTGRAAGIIAFMEKMA
ncbi:MAG: glycosyltransferase family 4 protein [Clostridia bacterium]|nr:glycosyltransferase family 4 protein [Clostridia bacterium]